MSGAAPVRLEASVWTEWRFQAGADALALELEQFIIRMARLWSWASAAGLKVVPAGALRTYLRSPDAVTVLLECDLVEPFHSDPITYRLKGSDRFEGLWKTRGQRVKGGENRARGARDAAGRFVSEDTDGPAEQSVVADTNTPAHHQQATSSPPADRQPAASSVHLSYSYSDSDQNQISDLRSQRAVERPDRRGPIGVVSLEQDEHAEGGS